jgi:hypothetical protein
MEEQEKTLDWLTTGIPYLLSKSGGARTSEITNPLHA